MTTRPRTISAKLPSIVKLIGAIAMIISCSGQKRIISATQPPPLANRIIILGLDGFSVEGFQTAKHPNLDTLLRNGMISLTTRAVMPSVTLPNWTSHLTGSGPEQHGIDNNDWTIDQHELPGIETDDEGYYPSVFKVLKERIPKIRTGYYYNWANLINPINQKYLDEISFLEDDRYQENYNKAFLFARQYKEDPTLIFLYSVHTDHAGHKHNWMSPEYIAAIEEADDAIGDLVSNLKSSGLYDRTHFLLITDHGGKGKGHGGMSPVEMNVPWAITGPGITKSQIMKEPNNNTNTGSVILRLFGIQEVPKSWVGEVPVSIFEIGVDAAEQAK